MYTNSNIVITGGTATTVHNHTSKQGFEKLGKHVATGALHNSAEVSDLPKCQPGTHIAILECLAAWAAAATYEHSIVWLNGPARSGKSSILRTIAQILFERQLLLAGFFFSRSAPGRNSSNHFVATIAYQLALNIPETRPYIEEAVERNPLIFSLSLWDQARSLIVSPILSVRRDNPSFDKCPFPRIIIVDGLDECCEPNKQCTILQVLCRIVKDLPIPFAVLVASRPEHHIKREFSTSGDLNQLSSRLSLDNSYSPGDPPEGYVESPSAIRDKTQDAEAGRDLTDDDDEIALLLADSIKRLQFDPQSHRFSGKSSNAMLIHKALELKSEYYDGAHASHVHPTKHQLKSQRAEFWTTRPWEKALDSTPTPTLLFPESDLAESCIELYFSHVNLYLPLLHRPLFQKSIKEGLHFTNQSFAYVYLLVCAVGARYSSDPRVRLDGVDSFHSSGWKWFNQVQIAKMSLLTPPTLYDLQRLCLSVCFLQCSSVPQSCWTLVGIGIRLAQEVGAHRRKLNNHTQTPEDELWKRAFWVLVCMDRAVSSSLGRPCATHEEDFDLDLPIDCDDEYWDNEDSTKRFKQPPNKPSLITAFILFIKLHQILAFSLRTIYSINKSRILLGFVGIQWEQHVVAELDSALNKWVDSVPDYLRWDPHREDLKFFNQSVTLYTQYYHTQILVHRPFIPSLAKPSPLSLPSLAICTNAARSCSHVIDVQRRRNPWVATIPHIQMAAFTSGIVLLLSIWGVKRSGLTMDPNKEMGDVHKCMQALRNSEHQWHSAGQYWDMLFELASVGDLPLPQPGPPGGVNKRERDSDMPISAAVSGSEMSLPGVTHDEPRRISGSKRAKDSSRVVSQQQRVPLVPLPVQSSSSQSHLASLSQSQLRAQAQGQMHKHQHPHPHQPDSESPTPTSTSMSEADNFSLPVYSNELGRIPLHQGITFPAQAPTFMNASANGGDATSAATIIPDARHSQVGLGHLMPPSSSGGFSSIGETSAMTVGQAFGIDAASLAMFDNMARMLGYVQQGSPLAEAEASMVQPPPLPVLDGSYRGMGMDLRGERDGEHQGGQGLLTLNGPSQQQQQQASGGAVWDEMYPSVDSDTIAMWSNAPTGFELEEWNSYLTNVSELMQDQHTSASG